MERFVQTEDPRWQEILRVRPGLTDPVTLSLRDEERLLASVVGDPEAYYRETLQPLKLAGYVDLPSPKDLEERPPCDLATHSARSLFRRGPGPHPTRRRRRLSLRTESASVVDFDNPMEGSAVAGRGDRRGIPERTAAVE